MKYPIFCACLLLVFTCIACNNNKDADTNNPTETITTPGNTTQPVNPTTNIVPVTDSTGIRNNAAGTTASGLNNKPEAQPGGNTKAEKVAVITEPRPVVDTSFRIKQ